MPSCAAVAATIPGALDQRQPLPPEALDHVQTCLSCQAELAKYHKLLRLLRQIRPHGSEAPPRVVTDVLNALEEAATRRVISSVLRGRRLAYAGALVAAPAAAGVALSVARRSRLRRASPMVLS